MMRHRKQKAIRTDGDVMRIADRMDDLVTELNDLYRAIANSDHPRADYMEERMNDNMIPVISMPSDVLSDCLNHPEQWEKHNAKYVHAAAMRAVMTLKQRQQDARRPNRRAQKRANHQRTEP